MMLQDISGFSASPRMQLQAHLVKQLKGQKDERFSSMMQCFATSLTAARRNGAQRRGAIPVQRSQEHILRCAFTVPSWRASPATPRAHTDCASSSPSPQCLPCCESTASCLCVARARPATSCGGEARSCNHTGCRLRPQVSLDGPG